MRTIVAASRLLFLLVSTLALSGSPGHTQNITGRITGRVADRTMGERVVSGQLVFLDMSTAEGEMTSTRDSTHTNAQGVFAFDTLAISDSSAYVLFTDYHLARYVAGPIILGSDSTAWQVDLVVYDSTSRSHDILVDRHHIIMQPVSDSLLVQEFLRLVNVGTRTFVGTLSGASEKRETIRVSLPPGASELELLAGFEQASISTDRSLISDSEPFPPGPRQILYSYILPLRENTAWYRSTLFYQHQSIDVFAPRQGSVLSASDLIYAGEFGDEQARYGRYSAQNMAAGHELAFSIVVKPSRNRLMMWVPLLALAIVLFLVMRSALRRRSRPVLPSAGRGQANPEQEKKALIQAIATLDERFERGELKQHVYAQRRAELKRKLASLMQEMDQPAGPCED